jgi:hypothetical protein
MRALFINTSRRAGYLLVTVALAVLMAACGSSSTTSTPTPVTIQRGQWLRPSFPGVSLPTVSAVAFADADQSIGYACSATLASLPAGTPSPTATAPASPTPSPTATLTIPGRPTPLPTVNNIANAFWRTSDGGLSWQSATLPPVGNGLLCPVSGIVVPDRANPNDVFFLGAVGSINIEDPTSILPGQLNYQLWRSLDGAQTWQKLTVPTAPNPLVPITLSPYHLVIAVNGQTLVFANNDSGSNILFISQDGGKSWTPHSGADLGGDSAFPDTHAFAGFARGPNGEILALATSPSLSITNAPLEVWQSADDGASWKKISDPTLGMSLGTNAHAQIFAAPDASSTGFNVYLLLNDPQDASGNATTTPTVLKVSSDGGVTWVTVPWPSSPTASGNLAGSATIAQLGLGFTVDAFGTAYFTPSNSDLSADQDPSADLSAGFFTISYAGGSSWSMSTVAQPPSVSDSTIGLAVSLATGPALTPAPSSPTATATSTPTPTATVSATAIPGQLATATASPTAPPAPTGLPVLWSNFGPLQQFTTNPDVAGFFFDVLP